MKIIIASAVILCLVAVVRGACTCSSGCEKPAAYTPGSSGRPDCSKYAEGKQFPNNNDPTKYWKCQSKEAVSLSCETSYLYQSSTGECVCYANWVWEPLSDPEYLLPEPEGCDETAGNCNCACNSK
ncbi:unnamed protein product [Hermetia illucens]|uniref:Chitin-binding type-2 domain-containing protein n=1 Tax=Hermetia illucens TaxID=343691 RepID=A0A7R8ULK0_HERIL|nr:uncharacterized protein LOC119648773 [Hermetia illucens]CAD7082267.1 unnamed protein product [Hermetia illucens]